MRNENSLVDIYVLDLYVYGWHVYGWDDVYGWGIDMYGSHLFEWVRLEWRCDLYVYVWLLCMTVFMSDFLV
jgi:hypothetical protein